MHLQLLPFCIFKPKILVVDNKKILTNGIHNISSPLAHLIHISMTDSSMVLVSFKGLAVETEITYHDNIQTSNLSHTVIRFVNQ